jgi:cytoskeletal protein RodZ
MSKRKGTSKKTDAPQDFHSEETPVARVVAIPKEPAAAAPKPKLERIGDILRQARQDRGDDLYQIAEYLCIKPSFLIALENSRYDEFPADAYVIGFLRTYANFLGVDGKDAVDRYRYEMAGRRRKPVLAMPTPVSEGKAPSGIIMVGVTIAAMLIYALWYGVSSSSRTEVTSPPPLPTAAVQPIAQPDANIAAGMTAPMGSAPIGTTTLVNGVPPESPGIMLTSPAPAAKPDETPVPTPAPAAKDVDAAKPDVAKKDDVKDAKKDDVKKDEPKKEDAKTYGDPNAVSRLIIKASQSSWIMVADGDGKTLFDHVLKPGDTYKVPNKDGLVLTTGNGAGISLILDGTEMPKVATGAPHVVRNISLDPDHLSDQ